MTTQTAPNLPAANSEWAYDGHNRVIVQGTPKRGRGYQVAYAIIEGDNPEGVRTARLADWTKGAKPL